MVKSCGIKSFINVKWRQFIRQLFSTQSSIIIPQPASSEYFYVFTVDDYFEDALRHGLSYSVVDICLDNGFGGVMSK